uniref:Uncharacterized protein n=1 Tax=Globodera rostochiensis TaxID=31243 RepID=A0A914H090_GLORO
MCGVESLDNQQAFHRRAPFAKNGEGREEGEEMKKTYEPRSEQNGGRRSPMDRGERGILVPIAISEGEGGKGHTRSRRRYDKTSEVEWGKNAMNVLRRIRPNDAAEEGLLPVNASIQHSSAHIKHHHRRRADAADGKSNGQTDGMYHEPGNSICTSQSTKFVTPAEGILTEHVGGRFCRNE